MEWLGGTISKEDVGPGGNQGGKGNKGGKRKRDDDNDEEALGALALRFRSVISAIYSALYSSLLKAPGVLQ